MTYNVNDYVYVKLTAKGREILNKKIKFKTTLLAMQGVESAFEMYPDSQEFSGYTRFQMWELMSIFGEHCFLGAENCFETEMKLTSKVG
jgi:hypothetical protein